MEKGEKMNVLVLKKIEITIVIRFHGRMEKFLEFAEEKMRDGYFVKIPSWPKN